MGLAPVLEEESRNDFKYYGQGRSPEGNPVDWVRVAACGSLIAGGVLLLAGKKREGAIAAVAGTALALLDHEETLSRVWAAIPSYVDEAERMIGQVQGAIDGVTEKGESLRRVFRR